GREGRIYRLAWQNGSWASTWEELGSGATSAPALAAWAPNRLSIFVRSERGTLLHRWWDGTRWQPWEDLGGDLGSAPACVSAALNRIDCFSRAGGALNPLNVDSGGLIRIGWRP
ncbi:MAG TPA: hypothetical protein PKC19_24015, partial [Roseiflexaceae bacterium]|nr:hypothetical protein [Roseiflexaceae bacterium]